MTSPGSPPPPDPHPDPRPGRAGPAPRGREPVATHDVAVIGAGPIGLEVALGLQQAGLDYVHLEAGQLADTVTRFPREMRFYSSNDRIAIGGLPLQTSDQSKASREQYLTYLRQVALTHGLTIRTFEPVARIEPLAPAAASGFRLTTDRRGRPRRYLVRRVVVATGGTARPARLGIPGEDLPHVDHWFTEPHRYFGQRVLIIGGKNSAAEAALRCYHAGARVSISYRRCAFDPDHLKYWILPELKGRIERGEIGAHYATRPVEITPEAVVLEPAGGASPPSRAEARARRVVPADAVLALIGFEADLSLLRQAGAQLAQPSGAPRFDETTMETTVPGLYVAGTVVAGTQNTYRVFLENCHIHAERIVAALTGAPPPSPPRPRARPES